MSSFHQEPLQHSSTWVTAFPLVKRMCSDHGILSNSAAGVDVFSPLSSRETLGKGPGPGPSVALCLAAPSKDRRSIHYLLS